MTQLRLQNAKKTATDDQSMAADREDSHRDAYATAALASDSSLSRGQHKAALILSIHGEGAVELRGLNLFCKISCFLKKNMVV